MKSLISFFILLLITTYIYPQVNYNQRDDKYRLLGLKRAKELYEVAKKDFDRAKDLYDKKFISEADFERIKGSYSDAEVNYQQSLLAVLFEQQFVTVEKAVKYQSKEGVKHVKLRIANASGGSEEYRKLLNIDEALFNSLQPDKISNVYVSLSNTDNSIISQPYETKINELKCGKPQDLDFILLQDLDALTVNIIYGNGTSRSMRIFLQKDASQNTVAVQSQQFSQESELGTSAVYDLTLELYSGLENTFSLEVVNLPQQVNRYFSDPGSNARLSQFKFTENVNTRKAALNISLPDRPTNEIVMDKPVTFYVMVIPNDHISEFRNRPNKIFSEDEIKKLNAGYVKLELIPKGKGRLLVTAPQLYYSIKEDGKIEAEVNLVNEGTQRLDNIELKLDVPFNWDKKIEPAIINSLGVSEEKKIKFQVTPPENISVGRYEIRIRTSGLSDNQPVNGEDKIVTAEILYGTNVLGTMIVVLLIIGVVAGIVVFGIKLTRK